MKQVVCKINELKPGLLKEVQFGKISIVVCQTQSGEVYAFSNRCIHQGAPLSKGKLCGTTAPTNCPGQYRYVKEGEVLRCPWHGREFDITEGGKMISDPRRALGKFQVFIDGEDVIVSTINGRPKGEVQHAKG
ncbi:Rieske (2Fe-2S) protein [Alicyclobacillus fructus]|uniref:Rieske (2Fe-2S) protein n=1 Tax=Alicyclobacillus fructus TaxID=2816082 RepID=UPI001A8F226B|nr:Rieske (2Fe-2S) protein [Alicyclobacillus fructus]